MFNIWWINWKIAPLINCWMEKENLILVGGYKNLPPVERSKVQLCMLPDLIKTAQKEIIKR